MALLPHKRTRDVLDGTEMILKPQVLAARILNHDTGESMILGGLWHPVEKMYKPLTKRQKSKLKTTRVHSKQWQLLHHCLDALQNYKYKLKGENFIQDILTTGGRQIGKTHGTGVAGGALMVARPGTHIAVVSARKSEASRLIGIIKKMFPKKSWHWDKQEGCLTLANHSKIWARTYVQYETLRGPAYDVIFIDEASLAPREVRVALTGNVITKNGFFVYMTTPRGHDWIYKIFKRFTQGGDEPSPDDIRARQTVRVVQSSLFDNSFLSEDARERALQEATSLSPDEYEQEINGKFIPEHGKAFPYFDEKTNIQEPETMADWGLTDITGLICKNEWGVHAEYILGIDLNYSPNSCVFWKVADNGSMWAVNELQWDGNVEGFCQRIEEELDKMGLEDPVERVAIVIDASSYWQSTGKHYTKKEAAKTFIDYGYRICPPVAGKHYNPDLFDRFSVTSRMVLNKAGESLLFVSRKCPKLLEMFDEIPLKESFPDPRWHNAHIYDAGTYPLYRLFAKVHINRNAHLFNKKEMVP